MTERTRGPMPGMRTNPYHPERCYCSVCEADRQDAGRAVAESSAYVCLSCGNPWPFDVNNSCKAAGHDVRPSAQKGGGK